jgi:hypothetical protein
MADTELACSSCGLTLEESRWLSERRALTSRPAKVDDELRAKLVSFLDARIATLKQENDDLRFNIGELMKAVAPSHTTNKDKD